MKSRDSFSFHLIYFQRTLIWLILPISVLHYYLLPGSVRLTARTPPPCSQWKRHLSFARASEQPDEVSVNYSVYMTLTVLVVGANMGLGLMQTALWQRGFKRWRRNMKSVWRLLTNGIQIYPEAGSRKFIETWLPCLPNCTTLYPKSYRCENLKSDRNAPVLHVRNNWNWSVNALLPVSRTHTDLQRVRGCQWSSHIAIMHSPCLQQWRQRERGKERVTRTR